MHDVTIRRATVEDVDAITSLAGELGYPTPVDAMRKRLETILAATDEHDVLVAVIGNEVAGWINLSVVTALESGSFAEIRGLVVTEKHRGARVGSQLVAAGEQWAVARKLPRMRVRSNVVRKRTHGFYEREGYVVTKEQKVFEKELP